MEEVGELWNPADHSTGKTWSWNTLVPDGIAPCPVGHYYPAVFTVLCRDRRLYFYFRRQ